MARKIVDVISISSADGWWRCDPDYGFFEPIVCWALVCFIETSYSDDGIQKAVVGLDASEAGRPIGVVFDRFQYVHHMDFEQLGEQLKQDAVPREVG